MRILRPFGVVVGVAVVLWLLRQVGLASVKETLQLLGWGYLIVLTYPLTWILINTLGWRWAIPPNREPPPLWSLMKIRIAGEAYNSMLPSGYVGGEPLKAKLLARWIPPHEAASSVLIAKAAQSIGLVFFIGVGLTFGHSAQGSSWRNPKTLWALGLLALGIFLFTLLLAQKTFSRVGRWLHRLTGHPWLQAQEERLLALDNSLGAFYRSERKRFLASIACHLFGWLVGALEIAVIFLLLGRAISWRAAWFMGAMGQMGSVLGLFIPAGLGFYEAGHTMAAVVLGLPPSFGLSISLIRRIREIFWDALGVGLYVKLTTGAGLGAPGKKTGTS
jgi:uncharacterized protein (TIRG00374 family)